MSDLKGKTCCKSIHKGEWATLRHEPCGKPAKVLVDGKPYCGIHNPDRNKDARKCLVPGCDTVMRDSQTLCSWHRDMAYAERGAFRILLKYMYGFEGFATVSEWVAEYMRKTWGLEMED